MRITSSKRQITQKRISSQGTFVIQVESPRKNLKSEKFILLKNTRTNQGLVADKFLSVGQVRGAISHNERRYIVLSTPMDLKYDSQLKVYDIATKKVVLEKEIDFEWDGRFNLSHDGKSFAYSNRQNNVAIIPILRSL